MRLQSVAVLSLVPWFGISSPTSGVKHPLQQKQVETSEGDSSVTSSHQNDDRFNPVTSDASRGVPNVLKNSHSDGQESSWRKPAQRYLLHDKLEDKEETDYGRTTSMISDNTTISSPEEQNSNPDIGILSTTSSSRRSPIGDYNNHDTLSRNLALTADPSSCTTTDSCFGAGIFGSATVGLQSCNADKACQYVARDDGSSALIGDYSCNAEYACNGSVRDGGAAVIHNYSCNSDYACTEAGQDEGNIIIYEESCNAQRACSTAASGGNAYTKIGPRSCNGYRACQNIARFELGSSAVVGADSCNGEYSCYGSFSITGNEFIGDRSCLGESSCAFQSDGEITIGDDSCSCDACCQDLDPGSVIGDCQCNDPCNPCTGYINNSTSTCTGSIPDPEDREKSCPSLAPSLSSAPSNPPSLSASPIYSASPSREPSQYPSQRPSESPSQTRPSESPSLSSSPSDIPSLSLGPTNEPTTTSTAPSQSPSKIPSAYPSTDPTASFAPSGLPSTTPSQSASPSLAPSVFPSELPNSAPLVCGSSVIPGNSCLVLECCDSATNSVGPRCCGTTPYDDALEQCCIDSLNVVPIGDGCPFSSPDEWCTLVVDDGCGDDKILTCTKHFDKDKDKYHFHQQCTKEPDLVGVKVGDFINNNRQLAACGCCLDDPMILQDVNIGDVDLKVAKSTKEADCPEPNLVV